MAFFVNLQEILYDGNHNHKAKKQAGHTIFETPAYKP
jgi:hypothetical protein